MAFTPMNYRGSYRGRNIVEISLDNIRGSTLHKYIDRIEILESYPQRQTIVVFQDDYMRCVQEDERDRIRESDMQVMGVSRLRQMWCEPEYSTHGSYSVGVDISQEYKMDAHSLREAVDMLTKQSKPKVSAHDLALKKVFWASRRLKELK